MRRRTSEVGPWVRSEPTLRPSGSPTRARGCTPRSASGSSPCSGSARSVSVRSDGVSRRRCSGSPASACSISSPFASGDRSGGQVSRRCCWRSMACTSSRAGWRCSTSSSRRSSRRRCCSSSWIANGWSRDRSVARWPRVERLFGSPYRLWAGVFLGCAMATKWSGAFALPFVAGLCAIWVFTGTGGAIAPCSPPLRRSWHRSRSSRWWSTS